MNAKERVKQLYPRATVKRYRDNGGKSYVLIWDKPDFMADARRIGEGKTVAEAWVGLARRIRLDLQSSVKDEATLLRMEKYLDQAGWVRQNCGNWEDPISGIHEPTSRAYQIAVERANLRKVRARRAKPLAILEVKMRGKWVNVYEIAEWKAECGWSSRLLEPITEIRVNYL